MKNTKNLLILFICLFPFYSSAQLNKGTTTLGGNAGLNFLFEDGDNLFQLNVAPRKTWFIADGLEVGGLAGLSFSAIEDFNGGTFQLAPMLNYYFNPTSSGLKLFACIEAGLIGSFGDFDDDTDFFLGFGLGGLSFLNENVAFQPKLSYRFLDDEFANISTISLMADLKAFLNEDSEEESAGISTGTLLIGGTSGSIRYQFYKIGERDVNRTSVSLTPKALYLLTEQLAVGGALNIGFVSGDFTNDVFTFGLLPEARYYFNPLSDNPSASFFGTLGTGIQHVSADNDFEDTSVTLNLGVGADFFIAQNIAIEGVFSYGYQESPILIFTPENRIGVNFFIQYFWNR